MDGSFGYIGYDDVRFDILYAVFKAPSDHLIEGERLPLELQIVSKNQHGDHLTLSVMFQTSHEPNHLLGLIGFGKGILGKLDNSNYKSQQTHNISDLAVTLKPFLINQGSWIMYEGSGLTAPCSKSTWLISMEPLKVTEQQLGDFALGARPDFTIKTIGNRTIFTNKLKDSDVDAKKLKELEHRETEIMLDRMRKKKEEALEKKKQEEQAKKEKDEKLRKAVLDYRTKKAEILFKDPPKVGEDPLITENLLKKRFASLSEYNFLHTPCKNYTDYLPPLDQNYGYVPADAVMVWELQSFKEKHKKVSVISEELPKPINTSYVFQPFYYIPKKDCHTKPANSSLTGLARSSTTLDISTGDATEYIPVLVETLPSYGVPSRPAITYKMAVPGRRPEVQDIVVNRKVVPDLSKFPEQDIERAKNYSVTSGFQVNPAVKRAYSPVPELKSPVDSRGRVIRVWPQFNVTRDGSVPEDAIYAWQGLKESRHVVLNVTVPKSFDPEYRWIVYMYLPCNYTVGEDKIVPLIPVYILARKEFNFTKDQIPAAIPVPATTDYVNGLIRAELITIEFTTTLSVNLLKDPLILQKPVGYDFHDIFSPISTYRRKMFLQQAKLSPVYFNETHTYYLARQLMPEGGRPEDLHRMEEEHVTGILILSDPSYREKLEAKGREKELELLQRLKKEADRKKRMEAIWNEPNRVVRYEKVCLEWAISVVLNDRSTLFSNPKETKDLRNCVKWEWKAITAKNELNKPENTTKPAEPSQKQEEAKKKILNEIENYCMSKVHVVLNDPRREAKDKHYELCKSTLDKLKKTDVSLFMSSLGPAFHTLKDQVEKRSERIQRAASELKDLASSAKNGIADAFDKKKHMKNSDFKTEHPNLAQKSINEEKLPKSTANKKRDYLSRVVSFANKVWPTSHY